MNFKYMVNVYSNENSSVNTKPLKLHNNNPIKFKFPLPTSMSFPDQFASGQAHQTEAALNQMRRDKSTPLWRRQVFGVRFFLEKSMR